MLVNCLLNAFAICVGEVNVFSLKVMVLFLGCFFWLTNPCMCVVFPVPRCSIHMSDLCVCMRDVISEFNSEIEGALAFCFCVLFCVLCDLGVVCMWSVSCLLGCCVSLCGE